MNRRQFAAALARGAALLCGAPFLRPDGLVAQSELVIFKEGTTLYHRPGCPDISDGVGVLALGRGQAESRGYKPHAACDPAQASARAQEGSPPSGRSAQAPPPVTVYLDGSRYYHRKDCSRLARKSRALEPKPLQQAGRSHWPCPTCKPPIRRRAVAPAVPGTERRRGR